MANEDLRRDVCSDPGAAINMGGDGAQHDHVEAGDEVEVITVNVAARFASVVNAGREAMAASLDQAKDVTQRVGAIVMGDEGPIHG